MNFEGISIPYESLIRIYPQPPTAEPIKKPIYRIWPQPPTRLPAQISPEEPIYRITPQPPTAEPIIPISPKQVVCPQCKSTLSIIPPSPETMVTQAFTWLICPVCGYSRLIQVSTGGFTVQIIVKQPWLPMAAPLKEFIPMEVIPPGKEPWELGAAPVIEKVKKYLPWVIAIGLITTIAIVATKKKKRLK